MLLAFASSVKALPAAQGILEDHNPMSRHLLSSKASAPVKSKPAQVATWAAAPSCGAMPTAASSMPDAEGRLWGWNQNTKKPCACKDPKNHVLFYVDYAPGSWLHTPACKSAPFPEDSVADSHFRVWGWDDGRLCAFKDDQQQPTPINKKNNRLAWADAPACTQEPKPTLDNAVPDRMGCLWGWQLDRNCAFKEQNTSEPKYIPGYNVTCTASLVASNMTDSTAVDIIGGDPSGPAGSAVGSADAKGDDSSDVGAFTSIAVAHKAMPPYYTPEEVKAKFDTNATNKGSSSGKAGEFTSQAVGDMDVEATTLPDNCNAPFSTGNCKSSGRRLLEVQAPKIKAVPKDCYDGGLGGLVGPGHSSKGNTPDTRPPCQSQQITTAEKHAVVRKAVPLSSIPEATYDAGVGGMTMPRPIGLARGAIKVSWLETPRNDFFAAEQATAQNRQIRPPMVDNAVTVSGLPSASGTSAVSDTMNRLWGYEKNSSCAFRAVNGSRLTYAGYKPLDWETSTACDVKPNATNSMVDVEGRLWGWMVGNNCAFKDAYGLPIYYPEYFSTAPRTVKESGDMIGHHMLPLAASLDALHTAHRRTPARKLLATATAVAVSTGGQAVSQSVANGKDATSSSQATSSGNSTALSIGIANGTATVANSSAHATGNQTAVSVIQAHPHKNSTKCTVAGFAFNNVTVLTGCDEPPLVPEGSTNTSAPVLNGLAASWKSAPSCSASPTKQTAVADTMNRLWGFEKNASCAFRAPDGNSLYYTGYTPLDWGTAAACLHLPNATNSMSDADGRLWGYASGTNC
ncbi:hypothetical protein OEZ86_006652, partial [Tetradesmus obliquus]